MKDTTPASTSSGHIHLPKSYRQWSKTSVQPAGAKDHMKNDRKEWIKIAEELNWAIEMLKNDPTDIKTWYVVFATQEAFRKMHRELQNNI
jgi:hypothetical protein